MLQQIILRASPAVLGPLLVGIVGQQQADALLQQLSVGDISRENLLDIITNLAASPAVTALKKKEESKKEVKKKENKGKKSEDPDPIKPSDLTPLAPDKEDIEKSKPLQILSGTSFIANVK